MPSSQTNDHKNAIEPYDFDEVAEHDTPAQAVSVKQIIDTYHAGKIGRALSMATEHVIDLDADALLRFDHKCMVAGAPELSARAFDRILERMATEIATEPITQLTRKVNHEHPTY